MSLWVVAGGVGRPVDGGGCDALVDGFMCCHQRCFEGIEVIAVDGLYLVSSKLDL